MVEMYTMQRFLDPEGLQEPRHRAFRRLGRHLRRSGRHDGNLARRRSAAAPQPLRPLHQPARTPADVPGLRRRADGRDARPAPARAWKAASRSSSPARCREEQHALQQELVARYDRLRSQKVDPREDNALAITTDGRKLALDARMLSATAADFPGSKVNALVENVAAIWQQTAATRGTQMIFCDMGVNPTPWGYSRLRRDHRQAGRPRHPARADRRHRRRRFRRQEAGPLREGPQRLGAGADRQHAEDGHRHQRPEAPGRPAPPRRPVEAGRGRAARGPHPAPGQRERGSGDLPLRHRRIVRRLYVAGPGDQGPVHRAR